MKKIACYPLLVALFLVGCRSSAPVEEIRVGSILPLSGTWSSYGVETRRGIELALDRINRTGGVKGHGLQLDVRDNHGRSVESTSLAHDFAQNEHIAIIGPLLTNNTLAAAAIAQEDRIPLVTPGATSLSVTEVGDYISRVCFVDPYQANAMANFAYFNLGVRSVCVIVEKHSRYSENLAMFFAKKFRRLGGDVLKILYVSEKEGEMSSLVSSLKRENIEGVYVPIYYDVTLKLLRAAGEEKLNLIFLGADGWDSSDFLAEVRGFVSVNRQVFFTTQFSRTDPRDEVNDFIRSYRTEFGRDPTALSALGYDALMLLADALRRSPSLSREALKETINSTRGFQGVTGSITLDEKRNAVKNIFIVEAEEEGVALRTAINALF